MKEDFSFLHVYYSAFLNFVDGSHCGEQMFNLRLTAILKNRLKKSVFI